MSQKLFNEAKKYLVGAVNSPVRSFKSVGGEPVFIKRAKGSKLYSESEKEYIDYCLSWGALILGHAHPNVVKSLEEAIKNGTSYGAATKKETELAKLIVDALPSIELLRLTNSGTEAVMGAIRLARAYTKKDKIIKFEGSYHGHADYLLVKAGSGAATLGISDSLGVPKDFTKHTLVLPYNDIIKIEETVKKYQHDLAAIIVEPIAANCGVIVPQPEFLQALRKIADKFNIVLIFDEVITGFRASFGGAQKFFQVKPDLTCLGKIVGGGLPIGVFGGRKEIMRLLAPEGPVYQAGTLSGNPIAVSAGITTLKILKTNNPYKDLNIKTKALTDGIKSYAKEYAISLKINSLSSIFSIFFTNKDVIDYKTAKTQNVDSFNKFFHSLLKDGIYISPSGFEANFLSTSHTDMDIKKTLTIIDKAFKLL